MKRTHFTADDRARFEQMWADGVSVREMSRAFGIAKETVREWRARFGLTPRPMSAKRFITSEEAEFLRANWRSMTVKDLERHFKTTCARLYQWAGELGLGDRVGGDDRPDRPSGKGGQYNGRRYEDHPRDVADYRLVYHPVPSRSASLCGNAASMCMES